MKAGQAMVSQLGLLSQNTLIIAAWKHHKPVESQFGLLDECKLSSGVLVRFAGWRQAEALVSQRCLLKESKLKKWCPGVACGTKTS